MEKKRENHINNKRLIIALIVSVIIFFSIPYIIFTYGLVGNEAEQSGTLNSHSAVTITNLGTSAGDHEQLDIEVLELPVELFLIHQI